jgi:starch synthase (maltosyl-transferring)
MNSAVRRARRTPAGAKAIMDDGRKRVVIEGVTPEVDCGRFPAKRIVGDTVAVEADIFTDGHDQISGVLRYRRADEAEWREVPLAPLVNDRWRGHFTVDALGRWVFTVEAWVDHFLTWHRDLKKRVAAGQDVDLQLVIGAQMIEAAAGRAGGEDRTHLRSVLAELQGEGSTTARSATSRRGFPTSPAWDSTCSTCRPSTPSARPFRKGKNNAPPRPDDVGSPWAIGGRRAGTRRSIPSSGRWRTSAPGRQGEGGTDRDRARHRLPVLARPSLGPEHPEWFRQRPDGTIQYAENPPKKYQDIYPFDFESEAWQEELWEELKSVFLHWIDAGVRIFRVDNPHTKPFPFWEW